MPSPLTCTAYRWQGRGSAHWLVILPNGQALRGRGSDAVEANGVISRISRAARCPLTVLTTKHPNDVEVSRGKPQ